MRTIRDRLGWTQDQLAERLEISREYVSMLERGVREPSRKVRRRIRELEATGGEAALQTSFHPDPNGPCEQALVYIELRELKAALSKAVEAGDMAAAKVFLGAISRQTDKEGRVES